MTASVDAAMLRVARQRAGMTQHQVARAVDIAGGERVAAWERGAAEPRPGTLRRLAEVFGVPVGDLLRRDGGEADLRYLRLAAGLESSEVAARVHVTPGTYLRWERGELRLTPSSPLVETLAGLFAVEPATVEKAFTHTRGLGAGPPA